MPLVRTLPRLVAPPWGGHALARDFGKGPHPAAALGESWEVWHENRVADGSGRRLGEVVSLPLLVKLLDTSEALSVQVHPDDDAARRLEDQPNGKAEAWVVLRAEPGARIAYGLTRELDAAALRERALSGAIEADLAWREVVAGEVLDVPPGTIHAIGGGLLLYEVQQPSDLTYRLYDWGRGRELHLDKAVAVSRRGPVEPSARPVALGPGVTRLLDHPCFRVEAYDVPLAPAVDAAAPTALTVVDGEVTVAGEAVRCGETVIAWGGAHALGGRGRVLAASVPGR